MSASEKLSRREREIMEIIYAQGIVTAREVWQQMTERPGYSTVRTQLKVLESKGHITHWKEGKTFYYRAIKAKGKVAQSALDKLVHTYFSGSVQLAANGLLKMKRKELSTDKLDKLQKLIDGLEGE